MTTISGPRTYVVVQFASTLAVSASRVGIWETGLDHEANTAFSVKVSGASGVRCLPVTSNVSGYDWAIQVSANAKVNVSPKFTADPPEI